MEQQSDYPAEQIEYDKAQQIIGQRGDLSIGQAKDLLQKNGGGVLFIRLEKRSVTPEMI